MSAYAQIKTQFKDKKTLIDALTEAGFTHIEDHVGNPQALVGYAHEKTKTADIIVRKAGSQGFVKDFGYVRLPDGTFSLALNDMDNHNYSKHEKSIANKYTIKAYQNKAKKLGLKSVGAPRKIGNKVILEYVKL